MNPAREKLRNQIKSMLAISLGGGLTFSVLNLLNGNEDFYRDYVMPLTSRLDPETSHKLAVLAMKHCLIKKATQPDPDSLVTQVWGMSFSNPIGIAAGFDKHAEAMQGLHRTGFGFVEIGSVTPKPQEGNTKPRVFRLSEDKAIINRYGFNSDGHEVVYGRVKAESEKRDRAVIGVNLGKNKTSDNAVEDYVAGVKLFGAVADYLVINISSPNTPGLRSLQRKAELEELVSRVVEARNTLEGPRRPPLLIKVAPDLSDEEKKDIASVLMKEKCRVDGIIVSNTTVTRPANLTSNLKNEVGGLSGMPLRTLSTQCVKDFYRLTKGQIPIVGVGGVASGQDAFEKILAGASLIQLYSSFAFEGPPVVRRIKRELDDILRYRLSDLLASSALKLSSVQVAWVPQRNGSSWKI